MQGLYLITDVKIMTVLADSLALVRPEDNITEKDMYPYKIQVQLNGKIYVSSKVVKSNSSTIENSQSGLVYHLQAGCSSYVILGLGIVDCSPRLFSKRMKVVLECVTKIPLARKLAYGYIAYMSRNRLQLTRKKQQTETSLEEYKGNMKSIIEKIKLYNPIEKIFLLTIAFPGPYLTERSWRIKENIEAFNEVLYDLATHEKSLIDIVDVYAFTAKHPEYILSDGHHISVEVHDFIAQSIVTKISIKNANVQ